MLEKKVVTRFAPSPTGFMHVGNVRTALYAWLWARKNNGTFILRIEDTDKEREVEGSILHIKESLKWLGLNWDQGPDVNGPHAPYIQSERLNIYKKYAQILINKGLAYPDPYTEEVVGEYRNKAELEKRPFLYREHRPENFNVWDGTKPLRFKIPEIKNYKWNDIVWGELSAGPEALDDFILIKSDGYPTYNFAHIVDDIEMGVTHVVRGQEFISSTPKFLAVYEALGVNPPLFVTTPPIMGADGKKKLGKRDGAKDILDYEKEGYLPDAMINYLAFLGFNPGGEKEIYIREELIKAFDLSKIQRSGAQWKDDKLYWMNKEHMKKLTDQEFVEKAKKYIDPKIKKLKNLKDESEFDTLILYFRDRIKVFSELNTLMMDNITSTSSKNNNEVDKLSMKEVNKEIISVSGPHDYFLKDPAVADVIKLLDVIGNIEENKITREYLIEIRKKLEQENWKEAIEEYAKQHGRGKVLKTLRLVLSGKKDSSNQFEIIEKIGKVSSLRRIDQVLQALKTTLTDIKELHTLTQTKTKSHSSGEGGTFTSSN